jgi:thiol-disulfide isomerase/thioredoxin
MRGIHVIIAGLGLSLGSVAVAAEQLLVFTASWCGPCQQFKQDLADNPAVLQDYVIDVIDAELARDMKKDFQVKSYPTFILVDVGPDGVLRNDRVLKRRSGYRGLGELQRWLESKR